MKNQLIHIISIALVVGSCTHMEAPGIKEEAKSDKFSVYISDIQTKTVNDGMSTKWVEGDNISIFHASTGAAEYVADGTFTCDNVAANKFSGILTEKLDGSAHYDWYAYYPSTTNVNGFSPKGSPQNETVIGSATSGTNARKEVQAGNSNMAHLVGRAAFPIAGFAKNVPGTDFPTLSMKNVSSVIAVNVTNTLNEPIIVNSVNLVAPEPIVGNFSLDFTNEEFVLSGGYDKFVQLEVTDGAPINKGESAKFYIGVAPFTATAAQELLLYVNATVGENKISQRLAKTLTEDVSFKSGLIKTFNVDYTQTAAEPINVTKSDFHTLNRGMTATSYKLNVEYDSFDGWNVLNGAVLPLTNLTFEEAQPDGNLIAGLTGDTKGKGVLTSPLIAGGCKSLTFQYGIHKKNNKIGFDIVFQDASGNVLYTETVSDDAPDMKNPYTYTFPNGNKGADVKIEGPFRIVITNNGPSQKTGVLADGLALYNIEWTSFQ